MKISVGISNELLWYKIFLDNYVLIKKYSRSSKMPPTEIIENYLICYIAIYNVFESYIDLLAKELNITLVSSAGRFKGIYTKINDIDSTLKTKIEKDITKIKEIRNQILHLDEIEFSMKKIGEKEIEDIVCDDNLYFKLPELLSNHNEIILLIEIIGKVFLSEYQTLYSIPNLPTYESVYELHKFIGVMGDMQEERGLKGKELNLPNF